MAKAKLKDAKLPWIGSTDGERAGEGAKESAAATGNKEGEVLENTSGRPVVQTSSRPDVREGAGRAPRKKISPPARRKEDPKLEPRRGKRSDEGFQKMTLYLRADTVDALKIKAIHEKCDASDIAQVAIEKYLG